MVRLGLITSRSWLEHVPELSNAETELSALTLLEENMDSELRYLQQRYAEATFDRTWQGFLFVLMRHATGFYCIFRSLIVCSRTVTPHPSHIFSFPSVPLERLPPRLTLNHSI